MSKIWCDNDEMDLIINEMNKILTMENKKMKYKDLLKEHYPNIKEEHLNELDVSAKIKVERILLDVRSEMNAISSDIRILKTSKEDFNPEKLYDKDVKYSVLERKKKYFENLLNDMF